MKKKMLIIYKQFYIAKYFFSILIYFLSTFKRRQKYSYDFSTNGFFINKSGEYFTYNYTGLKILLIET